MLPNKESSSNKILKLEFYAIFKRETLFESWYGKKCLEWSLDAMLSSIKFSLALLNVNYFLIKQNKKGIL